MDCSTGVLIKAGNNLLSRCSHYHGPQVLNGRVRNGNGCIHLGMVTGKSHVSVVRRKPKISRRQRESVVCVCAWCKEWINAVKRSAVSTGKLSALLHLHIQPIDPVVFREPSYKVRETSSCGGFHAYMPSAFILAARGYPAMPLARQLAHQRCVLSNPLVLGEKPLTFPAPTTDRDRPVSRRSKPSSRTAFIGEQPNPWELLHPQDAMSRHRINFHHF